MKRRFVVVTVSAIVALAAAVCLCQGVEPPPGTKDMDVPGWVISIIGFFANKWTLPVAFGALILTVVQVLRNLVALFGAQLGQKGIWIATAMIAFLAAFGDAAADGKVAGQEWVVVLTALASAIAACLGYRLLFSGEARSRLGK